MNTKTINAGRLRRLRVQSTLGDRYQLAQRLALPFAGDKRRDIYAAAGYDKAVDYQQYLARYLRQDVARRLVNLVADETWRIAPAVLDGLDTDTAQEDTPFTAEWMRVAQGGADEAETRRGLTHYLARLDRISGIGQYGVLYLGLADGRAPEEPAEAGSLADSTGLLFASVFDEGSAKVMLYETDRQSPRYGRPLRYQLTDRNESGSLTTFDAHWARCIHVADNLLASDLFGSPRLEAAWNRLIDLEKVMAATGEGGWTQMQPGYIFSTKDGYEADDYGADEREAQMDEFVHGLRRFLEMNGYEATTLAGSLQDPTGAVDNILKLISAATGIPARKLVGSERGELASSQDDDNWIDIIEARQQQHVTPAIIQPTINRLLWLGALPAPSSGAYSVWWPSLRQKNPAQQAEIADRNASALQKVRAKVAPRKFAQTYLPDLPEDAIDEEPEAAPAPTVPPPVAMGETDGLTRIGDAGDSAEGGGLADNAARPFRRWSNYP
jgi:hypothetical protein